MGPSLCQQVLTPGLWGTGCQGVHSEVSTAVCTFLLWPCATRSGGLAQVWGREQRLPGGVAPKIWDRGWWLWSLVWTYSFWKWWRSHHLLSVRQWRVRSVVSFPIRCSLVLPSHKSREAGGFGAESGKWQDLLPGLWPALDCGLPLA